MRTAYFYESAESLVGFTFGSGIEYRKFHADIGIDEKIYDFPTQNRMISLSYFFN
jgi:hypothetical protein